MSKQIVINLNSQSFSLSLAQSSQPIVQVRCMFMLKTKTRSSLVLFCGVVPVHFHWRCAMLLARTELSVCVLTSFVRPTYHHEYVPSSVHTPELTVLLSKIKFIIVLCACAFHLINFLLPVWYLLRWSSADFFLRTVCCLPVSWLCLITYVPYSWMFLREKKTSKQNEIR